MEPCAVTGCQVWTGTWDQAALWPTIVLFAPHHLLDARRVQPLVVETFPPWADGVDMARLDLRKMGAAALPNGCGAAVAGKAATEYQ